MNITTTEAGLPTMTENTQNKATPWPFFHAVQDYFGIEFVCDMAATEDNTKCEHWVPPEVDALSCIWQTKGWLWLNPPFHNLTKWIQKVKEQKDRGCRIVTLWPLSGDRNQIVTWQESQVNVIHGRIWPEVRGCMLCRWDADPTIVSGSYVGGITWNGEKLERVW
jgi:phage N-6-adenine-methyltransferase